MTDEYTSLIIVMLTLVGFLIGRKAREITCMWYPIDPITILYNVPLWLDFIYDWSGYASSPWYVALLVSYPLGYITGTVLSQTITTVDLENYSQTTEEIAYYFSKRAGMCVQPQSLRELMKRLVFGVHHPLIMDMGDIKREMRVHHANRYYWIRGSSAICSEHTVTPAYKQVWRFKLRYNIHEYHLANITRDAPYDFMERTNLYSLAIRLAREAQGQALKQRIEAVSRMMVGSADLVADITDTCPQMATERLGTLARTMEDMEALITKEDDRHGDKERKR